jgi:hypothetical protein
MVPVGICSTLTTLPPFPCPSSAIFLKSELLRSSLGTSAFKSSFANVFDRVLCIALRRPVAGLSIGIVGSRMNPFEAPSSPKGGGRFLAPGRGAGRGAGRDATGSGTEGAMGSSGRTRDLKFLLVRKGVEVGV